MKGKMPSNEEEWQKKLTAGQYHILRRKGTEPAFSGKLLHNKDSGIYYCAGCESPLFSSKTKFESGTGWPSFYEPVSKNAIEEHEDDSLFMKRIEIICKKCKSHLGHLFDDGPTSTGKRFCINSCSLNFKK